MSDFPLPVLWRFDVPWSCWVRCAPLVHGNEVVAVCGPRLVGLDGATGKLRWKLELPDGGDGELLARFGDQLVTSCIRKPERLVSILGVTRSGVTWRTDLPIMLAPGNAIPVGDEVWVFGRGPVEPPRIRVIDPATGEITRTIGTPDGVTSFLPIADGFLFGARAPGPTEHVLVRVRNGKPQPIPVSAKGGVWSICSDGDVVVTVVRSTAKEPRVVEARDANTLEVLWTAPAIGDVAAIDGGQVAFVEGTPSRPVPALRDARTGAVAWTGEPLPGPGAAVLFLGPLVVIVESESAAVYSRDGKFIGDAVGEFGFAGTCDSRRLLIGASEGVVCARVPPAKRSRPSR
jgi:outer membrane protein assembly factor BamB